MQIRQVKSKDLWQITEIANKSFKKPWSFPRFAKQYQTSKKFFLVSEENQEITGFSVAREDGLLMLIAVKPEYRSKQTGSKLLEKTLQTLKENNVKRAFGHVRKSNDKVLDFYTKHGFRKKPEPGYYSDEDGWRLEKTL